MPAKKVTRVEVLFFYVTRAAMATQSSRCSAPAQCLRGTPGMVLSVIDITSQPNSCMTRGGIQALWAT